MKRNAPVATTVGLIAAAVLIAMGAITYLVQPASSLPSFFPGHVSSAATDAGHHHVRHGLAALSISGVLLALAWITTGPRRGRS